MSAAAVLVLSACGSSGGKTTSTTTSAPATTAAGAGTTTSTVAAGVTTTTGPLSPALPAPAKSGALHIAATIPVNVSPGRPLLAEAPDGAVFVAQVGQAPVWVIDGDQPSAIAEHVSSGVKALAADADNLYVATFTTTSTTVFRFSRTTGSQVGQWALPVVNTANTSDEQLISVTAVGGAVWVSIVAGNDVNLYRAEAGSSAAPVLIATTLGAAIGPDGAAYYERTDGHLVRRSPTGQLSVGPALANSPNGEGGGVQDIDTVAAGVLWVDEPAGQGLDAQLSTFNLSTLAAIGTFGGNTNELGIIDTLAGPLVLAGSNASSACPSTADGEQCVQRISTSAVLSDATPVGAGFALAGPYPAVVTSNPANTELQVDRLS